MGFRDECLPRIDAARATMDEALRVESDASVLRDTWHAVLEQFNQEPVPEADRVWLSDRLLDLRVHVFNSPRWQQLVDADSDWPTAESPERGSP